MADLMDYQRYYQPPTQQTSQPAGTTATQPPAEQPKAFDPYQQVGHDGTTSTGMTRDQYRDAWMGSGAKSSADLDDFLSKYGGKVTSGNGSVMTPFGETIDMLINARGSAAGQGQASAGWGGVGGGGTAPTSGAGSSMESMMGGGAPGIPVASAASGITVVQVGGEGDPFAASGGGVKLSNGSWVPKDHPLAQQAGQSSSSSSSSTSAPLQMNGLIDMLMKRANQSLQLDANDPIIKGQVDNYSAMQERDRRQYNDEAAEALAARGLGNSGALQNEKRMSGERAATATSGFQSELLGRELQTRRDEITHALDSMGNLLSERDRLALQKELATLDNAMQKYGIDTQNRQYFAGLSQGDKHFYDQLAQTGRLADQGLGLQYAQLGQQGQQWDDRMGFDTAEQQAKWDAIRRGIL